MSENWQQTDLNLGTNSFGITEHLTYSIISSSLFLIRVSPQNTFEPHWEFEHSTNQVGAVAFIDKENLRTNLANLEMTQFAWRILTNFINRS